ncbi:hypothetical protein WAI453_007411 [Rhynchosporium graminicola]
MKGLGLKVESIGSAGGFSARCSSAKCQPGKRDHPDSDPDPDPSHDPEPKERRTRTQS